MSGGRWRLQHVDDDSEDWEMFQVCLITEEDSEVVMQCFDEKWARHAIKCLRWMDSFEEGNVSIPKPKPVRKRTARSKA